MVSPASSLILVRSWPRTTRSVVVQEIGLRWYRDGAQAGQTSQSGWVDKVYAANIIQSRHGDPGQDVSAFPQPPPPPQLLNLQAAHARSLRRSVHHPSGCSPRLRHGPPPWCPPALAPPGRPSGLWDLCPATLLLLLLLLLRLLRPTRPQHNGNAPYQQQCRGSHSSRSSSGGSTNRKGTRRKTESGTDNEEEVCADGLIPKVITIIVIMMISIISNSVILIMIITIIIISSSSSSSSQGRPAGSRTPRTPP